MRRRRVAVLGAAMAGAAAAALLPVLGAVGAGEAPARDDAGFSLDAAARHVHLTASSPTDGARRDAAPAQVRLTFNAPLRTAEVRVEVAAPAGSATTVTPTPVTPSVETSTVVVDLPAAVPPGRVGIRYRVVARSGRTATGRVAFSVR